MAILISGIGRSGTTTLYEIIGKALLAQHGGGRCVYEPYLWNIPEIESTADTHGQPFNVGQVGLFNMTVHCNTPLFLSNHHMLHDAWLKRVFGPAPAASQTAPDNVMAKVIRGAGRIEAALTRFENLKVIAVTRNVIDTVNSGLGLFTFYGDEFHPSDKHRFVNEVNSLFNANLDASKIKNEMEWSVLWWHYFTEASIRTYQKFPDRVMLVPYEKYIKDNSGIMKQIFKFCGIKDTHLDTKLFSNDAGPRTSVSYLDNRSIELMNDELEWYFTRLKNIDVYAQDSNQFRNALLQKYNKRKYVQSLLLTEKPDHTAVMWRIKLKNCLAHQGRVGNASGKEAAKQKIFTVAQAMSEFGANETALAEMRKKQFIKATPPSKKPTLGVLITNFNNVSTIEESICSVLLQSKKPDLIVVADDCSTDGSQALLKKLAARHKNIQLVLRPENVGVAANRDLAIRDMNTDYITTLDGDDLFLPGKLELEYSTLDGSTDKVAFSNIALLNKTENSIMDTSAYSGKPTAAILQMLTSRSAPVPRDMMFPKSLFTIAEGFDVALNMYEDWAFKMRLMLAAKGGWIWSGGIGTVYDRRNPGLSGKEPIFHAHGQMIALARNVRLLKAYPTAILAGLRTASSHLGKENKERMSRIITKYERKGDFDRLVVCLEALWNGAYVGEDVQKRRADINQFIFSINKQ